MSNKDLARIDVHDIVNRVFCRIDSGYSIVQERFDGIYYKDFENKQIDLFCANIKNFKGNEKRLLIYLMGQAMLMKRPYNLFHRANLNIRTKDVPRSFGNAKTWERTFEELMIKLGSGLGVGPFYGPTGSATAINSLNLEIIDVDPDLIYIDPPYLNKRGVPVDYSNLYNFLEGLVDYKDFGTGNEKYPHQPIAMKKGRWGKPVGGLVEFQLVAQRWPRATLAISYRGDGTPTPDEIKQNLFGMGYKVQLHSATQYKYALSKSADTTEDLFIAFPKV